MSGGYNPPALKKQNPDSIQEGTFKVVCILKSEESEFSFCTAISHYTELNFSILCQSRGGAVMSSSDLSRRPKPQALNPKQSTPSP